MVFLSYFVPLGVSSGFLVKSKNVSLLELKLVSLVLAYSVKTHWKKPWKIMTKNIWMFQVEEVLCYCYWNISYVLSQAELDHVENCKISRESHIYMLTGFRIRSWNPWAQLVFISNVRVTCDIIQIFSHIRIELGQPCVPSIIKFRNIHLHNDKLLAMHHNRLGLLLLYTWIDNNI